MYTLQGYGSPSGKPHRPSKKFTIDLDNPDDQERLIKAVARGEALTSAAPTKAIPKTFQPLFKHPLPISDHSGYHESNLKRVQCCKLEKQAAAAVTLADSWVLEEVYLNGAPVDIPDKNGFSPIHTAVKVNSFECVMALINMKVNINATTLTGVTPLFLAKSVSSKEIVQALVENDGVVEVKNHDEIAPIEILEVGKARDKSLLDHVDDSLGPRRNTLF
jgi:hypothetical protein